MAEEAQRYLQVVEVFRAEGTRAPLAARMGRAAGRSASAGSDSPIPSQWKENVMLSKQGAARVLAVDCPRDRRGSLTGRAMRWPRQMTRSLRPSSSPADPTLRPERTRMQQRSRASQTTPERSAVRPLVPLDGAADGETTIETCGSDFDTLLAAYTGVSVSALTEVAGNDDVCGFQSSISFAAEEGETYRIVVDGRNGVTGLLSLQLRLAPPNDDFADAVVVTGDAGSVDGTNEGASVEALEPGSVSGLGVVSLDGTVDRAGHLHDMR